MAPSRADGGGNVTIQVVLMGAARWRYGIFRTRRFFAHGQRHRRRRIFCDTGPLTLQDEPLRALLTV